MSKPQDLKDLYTDELKDLWSANDQMHRCVKKILSKASDQALKDMLAKSITGIDGHTALLKELLAANNEKVSKEHCKGMEGLAAEAIKHTTEEAPDKGPVLDAQIIAQYQRMSHYGICGFGTITAYAKALGLKEDYKKLSALTKDVYGADEYMTQLSKTVNAAAKD